MRILDCMLAVTLGIWLALLSYGILWLTLKGAPRTGKPSVLFMSSFLGRAGGVLYCFYHISQNGGWERLIACVGGFIFIRTVLGRLFDLRMLSRVTAGKELFGREQ